MSYIKIPKLFNTGYLPYGSVTRMKQNLSPQELSNNCQYMEQSCFTNNSDVNCAGGVCTNETLYPFYSVPLIYDQNEPGYDPRYLREPFCCSTSNENKIPPLTTGSNVYPVNTPDMSNNPEYLAKKKFIEKNLSSGPVPESCNCSMYTEPA